MMTMEAPLAAVMTMEAPLAATGQPSDLEVQDLQPGDGADPVSYTHLTLPTTPYV